MRRFLSLGILGCLFLANDVRGQDVAKPGPAAETAAAKPIQGAGADAKLLESVREALERNAQLMVAADKATAE